MLATVFNQEIFKLPVENFSSNDREGAQFRTTHWSVVLDAGHAPERGKALETLCRSYWYPLYAFVRRRGYNPYEAQDLTQEFFMQLLDGAGLESVYPEKGRFRTFLLAAMKNFLAKQWRNSRRLKRGGAYQLLSWEELEPEERYAHEPETGTSPEEGFDRHWARTLATKALETLRSEQEREGNGPRFEALKAYLQTDGGQSGYAETARRLGFSEAAVKSAIHPLRRPYAEIIRSEIGETVESPSEIEAEIRTLIDILAS